LFHQKVVKRAVAAVVLEHRELFWNQTWRQEREYPMKKNVGRKCNWIMYLNQRMNAYRFVNHVSCIIHDLKVRERKHSAVKVKEKLYLRDCNDDQWLLAAGSWFLLYTCDFSKEIPTSNDQRITIELDRIRFQLQL